MKNDNKKLNTFTLSALIIGPLLGSGIILLPPLIYDLMQNYSLFIFGVISLLGFAFALIFGKLSIMYSGEGGVSLATKNVLGKKYQLLTSFYLILAVCFGPVVVVLIAAEFLTQYFNDTHLIILSFIIYTIIYLLLLIRITFLGKIMLFLTSTITIVLLVSSINVLVSVDNFDIVLPGTNMNDIGYAFLLGFWAIVGWEVIGNYSNEVENTKTITNSILFSVIVVSLIYMLLIFTINFGNFPLKGIENFNLVWVLEPLFKGYANIVLVSIAVLFCVITTMLFMGGVGRLISSLNLSKYLSKHSNSGSPIGALNLLAVIHITILSLTYLGILTKADLVAFADGFFIANAIIGLITAIMVFDKGFLKFFSYLLLGLFFIILLFSNIYILITILALFLYTYFGSTNKS